MKFSDETTTTTRLARETRKTKKDDAKLSGIDRPHMHVTSDTFIDMCIFQETLK